MIKVKKPEEIEIIKEGGKITAFILRKILAKAKPGVRGIELENLAESLINKFKVKASFRTVDSYPFAICLSLNEEVVHGLPGKRKLKDRDLVSIDFGVLHKGWHSDMARTILVSNSSRNQILETSKKSADSRFPIPDTNTSVRRFLQVGEEALEKAIKQARIGNRVGNVSLAIQEIIEGAGYSVVKSLTGHGVGRKLHEDPQVPCFLSGRIEETPALKEGMVLAIEVMYSQKGEVKKKGWAIVTRDGSPAGHFENTIAITKKGPVVLTR